MIFFDKKTNRDLFSRFMLRCQRNIIHLVDNSDLETIYLKHDFAFTFFEQTHTFLSYIQWGELLKRNHFFWD